MEDAGWREDVGWRMEDGGYPFLHRSVYHNT